MTGSKATERDAIFAPRAAPSLNGSTHEHGSGGGWMHRKAGDINSLTAYGSAFHHRRPPQIEVVFVTPNLFCGGVETWLLGLLRYSPPAIHWSIALLNPAWIEPFIVSEVERYADVVTSTADITALLERADVALAWRVTDVAPWFGRLPQNVILVSHGSGKWTEHALAGSENVATHRVAVSQSAAAAFKHPAVTVLRNGVDPLRCQATRPRDEVRSAWGLLPEEKAIGFVGRLSPEKNPLATSHAVLELGVGYRAVYIGTGYGGDLRGDALRLTPDAIFAPAHFQIGDALQALDCLIMASPCEGYSMSLVEGLLAGVPVVATPVGIGPEILYEYGEIFVPLPIDPSPAALATAVRRALGCDHRSTVARAQRVMRRRFSAEAMAAHWAEHLLRVVGR